MWDTYLYGEKFEFQSKKEFPIYFKRFSNDFILSETLKHMSFEIYHKWFTPIWWKTQKYSVISKRSLDRLMCKMIKLKILWGAFKRYKTLKGWRGCSILLCPIQSHTFSWLEAEKEGVRMVKFHQKVHNVTFESFLN